MVDYTNNPMLAPLPAQQPGPAAANPFDQFDGHAAAGNPFDQFDARTQGKADSGVSSFARGILSGATFGLSEPAVAAIQATVGDPTNPTSHAPDWSARYHENLAALRGGVAADQQAHPVASTAGEIAGGFANPANRLLGPVDSLGDAVRVGAKLGMGYGAGNAVADDNGLDGVATGALRGAAFGGATGGVMQKVGGAVSDALQPRLAPTIQALKDAAQSAYTRLDNSGVKVGTDALNALGDSAADKFGGALGDPDISAALYPKASAALRLVSSYGTDGARGDASASFGDLDKLRRVVADAAATPDKADRFMARQILDHVDNFVGGLSPDDMDTTDLDAARAAATQAMGQKGQVARQLSDIQNAHAADIEAKFGTRAAPFMLDVASNAPAATRARYMQLRNDLNAAETARTNALGDFADQQQQIADGPAQALQDLTQARDYWKRYSQASQLQSILDKAGNNGTGFAQAGYENAIRSGFRKLLNNDRAIGRFSPEVRAAIQQVATGGNRLSATNLLRDVGKLSPQGAVPILAEAGMFMGGGAPTLALPAAGFASRMAATALQKAAANRAIDLAATGGAGAAALPRSAAVPPSVLRLLLIQRAAQLPRLQAGLAPVLSQSLPAPIAQ
ncbi:MAG TPA: hypothetical protein VGH23_20485 [Rhizomicrobium sp.]|jgi:hypothetical protein